LKKKKRLDRKRKGKEKDAERDELKRKIVEAKQAQETLAEENKSLKIELQEKESKEQTLKSKVQDLSQQNGELTKAQELLQKQAKAECDSLRESLVLDVSQTDYEHASFPPQSEIKRRLEDIGFKEHRRSLQWLKSQSEYKGKEHKILQELKLQACEATGNVLKDFADNVVKALSGVSEKATQRFVTTQLKLQYPESIPKLGLPEKYRELEHQPLIVGYWKKCVEVCWQLQLAGIAELVHQQPLPQEKEGEDT